MQRSLMFGGCGAKIPSASPPTTFLTFCLPCCCECSEGLAGRVLAVDPGFGEHLLSWMQLYQQSAQIDSGKISAVVMKTSPLNPVDWEFTGLKSMQQLQALKETALVYDKAPIQNTAGDYSFLHVEWLH